MPRAYPARIPQASPAAQPATKRASRMTARDPAHAVRVLPTTKQEIVAHQNAPPGKALGQARKRNRRKQGAERVDRNELPRDRLGNPEAVRNLWQQASGKRFGHDAQETTGGEAGQRCDREIGARG